MGSKHCNSNKKVYGPRGRLCKKNKKNHLVTFYGYLCLPMNFSFDPRKWNGSELNIKRNRKRYDRFNLRNKILKREKCMNRRKNVLRNIMQKSTKKTIKKGGKKNEVDCSWTRTLFSLCWNCLIKRRIKTILFYKRYNSYSKLLIG